MTGGCTMKNSHKLWTTEEEDYLKEYAGERSISKIARNLGRTVAGVQHRMKKVVGSATENTPYVTITEISRQLHIKRPILALWRQLPEDPFPCNKMVIAEKKENSLVDLEDMWNWLYRHPDKWNAYRLEEGALGVEPEWVDAKRRSDFAVKKERMHWTEKEKEQAILFYGLGQTYEEIGKLLGRPWAGVYKKIWEHRKEKMIQRRKTTCQK